MRIEGDYLFAASREQVWRALLDPQVLANSVPGLRRLDVLEDNRYEGSIEVGIGVIKGTYDGAFELTVLSALEACEIRGSATGRQGSFDTVARMEIADRPDGGASMTYSADASVTGPVAGVGQRMIGSVAQRLVKQFLASVEASIGGTDEIEPVAPSAEPKRSDTHRREPAMARTLVPQRASAGQGSGAGWLAAGVLAGAFAGIPTGMIIAIMLGAGTS